MKKVLTAWLFIAVVGTAITQISAQSFVNGDLNGSVGISTTPTGWAQVAFTDPNSIANQAISATSDVTSTTGPSVGAGIHGNPYSGSTFTCGLKGTSTWGYDYHEGLQQTVSGFTPGNSYTVSFRQTVVKQSNALDGSGGWQVMVDNAIIGFSATSFSSLPYSSNNLTWDLRSLSFTATSTTHTIKFLPNDNDANTSLSSDPNGAVRMGIDSINLFPAIVFDVEMALQGEKVGEEIELFWEMHSDEPINSVMVERSRDGFVFEDLGQGYAHRNEVYTYRDAQPYPQNYYRLRVMTLSGNTYFSNVVYLEHSDELQAWVHGKRLYLRGGDGQYAVEFYDLSGALVYAGMCGPENELGHLANGAYLLKVAPEHEGQAPLQQKVVVVK